MEGRGASRSAPGWRPQRARSFMATTLRGGPAPASVRSSRFKSSTGIAMGAAAPRAACSADFRSMHADDENTTCAAAARGAAESIWVPASLLPVRGACWRAAAEDHIVVTVSVPRRNRRSTCGSMSAAPSAACAYSAGQGGPSRLRLHPVRRRGSRRRTFRRHRHPDSPGGRMVVWDPALQPVLQGHDIQRRGARLIRRSRPWACAPASQRPRSVHGVLWSPPCMGAGLRLGPSGL
jgi:hypothetical protein